MALVQIMKNNPAEELEAMLGQDVAGDEPLPAVDDEAADDDGQDSRLYEAGFHIVPMVGDEGVATEVDAVRKAIEGAGAKITAEESPRLLELGYPMRAVIDRKHHVCESAYFGWMLFEATPSAAHAIKEVLGRNENILRFLLIKTVKEAATVQHPAAVLEAAAEAERIQPGRQIPMGEFERRSPQKPRERKPEAAGPADVEQIDAEIEKLLVE